MLDAHFTCDIPGPSACLQDALHMITTGKVRITCPGRKKRKKDEQQEEDDEEPRALSELEVQVIKEWYIQREGSEVSGTCSGETDEELFAYIGPEQRRKELRLKKNEYNKLWKIRTQLQSGKTLSGRALRQEEITSLREHEVALVKKRNSRRVVGKHTL